MSSVAVNALVYYQKPALGRDGSTGRVPTQLVFPSGGFGLGLAVGDEEAGDRAAEDADEHNGVLVSAPQASNLDRRQVAEYKIAFLCLTVVNVVITCGMFFNAHLADPSRVESGTGYLPSAFEEVTSKRRPIEKVNLALLLVLQVVGAVAAWREQPTGLSAFALGTLLNFFLSTAALPFFLFALRFVVDFVQMYSALVLRSRLTLSFLVLNPHRF